MKAGDIRKWVNKPPPGTVGHTFLLLHEHRDYGGNYYYWSCLTENGVREFNGDLIRIGSMPLREESNDKPR